MNTKTTAEKTKVSASARLFNVSETAVPAKTMNASETLIQSIAPLAQANSKATKARERAAKAARTRFNNTFSPNLADSYRSHVDAFEHFTANDCSAHVAAYQKNYDATLADRVNESATRLLFATRDVGVDGGEVAEFSRERNAEVNTLRAHVDAWREANGLARLDLRRTDSADTANVNYTTSGAGNPRHDAAQRTHDRKAYDAGNVIKEVIRIRTKAGGVVTRTVCADKQAAETATIRWGVSAEIVREERTNENASDYLRKRAARCAHNYIQKADMNGANVSHMRGQFTDAALSGINEAIASITTNDTLTQELLGRLALNVAQEWIQKRIAQYAFRQCDRLRRHMAKNVATETSYFDGYDATFAEASPEVEYTWRAPEHSGSDPDAREEKMDTITRIRATNAEKLRKINATCDQHIATVSAKLARATSNRERGHLAACAKLIERAREWATASVESRVFEFRTPLTFHAEHETIVARVKCGEHMEKEVAYEMSTGKVVSKCALQKRYQNIAYVLGIAL
jgi:hypothetical protein